MKEGGLSLPSSCEGRATAPLTPHSYALDSYVELSLVETLLWISYRVIWASATFGGLSGIHTATPRSQRLSQTARSRDEPDGSFQLDNLRLEVQRLEVENARLREERPEEGKSVPRRDGTPSR